MNKPIRVGLDFDGVVAYNPFRVVRPFIAFAKRNVLGVRKLQFFYPQRRWQQIFWIILHESSIFPAPGVDLLRELIEKKIIEVHLVTARYSFLDHHLNAWLKKHNLVGLFKTINWNKQDEQPHIFKEKLIKKLNVDYFIEDNLDIVVYLEKKKLASIYWIYNIIDRRHSYPYKFPHMREALEAIIAKKRQEFKQA